jgi:hypothetical protein
MLAALVYYGVPLTGCSADCDFAACRVCLGRPGANANVLLK